MDTLGRQDRKIQEQQQRIDALNEGLAAVVSRLSLLEQANAIQRVRMMGTGPTVS